MRYAWKSRDATISHVEAILNAAIRSVYPPQFVCILSGIRASIQT